MVGRGDARCRMKKMETRNPGDRKGVQGSELGSLTGQKSNVSSISSPCQWLEPLAHLAGGWLWPECGSEGGLSF